MAAGVGAIGVACAVTARGAAGRDAWGFAGVAVSVLVASALRSRSVPVQLATTSPVMSAVAMTRAMAIAVTFHGFNVFICHLLFARHAWVTSRKPLVTITC